MTLAIAAVLALIAGLAIGYWMRSHAAQAQITAARAEKSMIEQSLAAQTAELGGAKSQLEQVRAESAARAGFESLATERQTTIDRLAADLEAKAASENSLTASVGKLQADLNNERANMAEKLALLETAKQTLANQFQALAADILDQKSKSFSEASQKELQPLQKEIENFRKKVEEAQRDSLVGRTEISKELEQLRNLNEKLSSEAHSLSTALRQDTQKQGHWGEQILLQILENSGLLRGEHYIYQESHAIDGENGQQGRQQPDVIVKLPEGRHLIIDSKVTLTAYQEYANANGDKEREVAVKRLLKSFRDHYTELAERNYHQIHGIKSPDFVVLFAPIEPAFMLAIREDETIWNDAYQKGVLLAGPTTILFVVRIVENLWRQERQQRSVQKVVERGEKLYDKFVGFVEDLELIGKRIDDAGQSYKDAFGKLTSGRENLVRQVEMLRELGLRPKKRLNSKLVEEAGVEDTGLFLAAEAEDATHRES
ncbi:MAG: DNA recombination protein RmuC [Terracidiphilus sp.]